MGNNQANRNEDDENPEVMIDQGDYNQHLLERAQEHRINEPQNGEGNNVIAIKNDVNLLQKTLKLIPHPSEEGKYYLSFRFDSNYECQISVYFLAMEVQKKAKNIPIFFWTIDRDEPVNIYRFSKGFKQEFPKNVEILDTFKYELDRLTTYDEVEGFYPCVIKIDAVYPMHLYSRFKPISQITYCTFRYENEAFKIKPIKKSFVFDKLVLGQYEIYGMERRRADSRSSSIGMSESIPSQENEQDEYASKECVVCYTSFRDTVVLPCRHMCLCYKCALIVRMQNSKCPLCRTKVTSFMNIKITPNENENENEIPAVGNMVEQNA